jgi:hypothetical protein
MLGKAEVKETTMRFTNSVTGPQAPHKLPIGQNWEIGKVVKIGFLTLRVVAKEPTPGDYMPDAYRLIGLGKDSVKLYRFVPHNGLKRIN